MPPKRWIADKGIARNLRGSRLWHAWVRWDRFQFVVRLNWRYARKTWAWFTGSREHSNYTYELTARNVNHLAWWVADLVDRPVAEIRSYIDEIENDHALQAHIAERTEQLGSAVIADSEARYGRRAGWYAIVRALRPDHVIETGTDKGLGSCVLAAALLRNGSGTVTTIDTEPDSGYLIGAPYDAVIDRRIGDSHVVLGELRPADIFLHDSLHTYDHEAGEYRKVTLTPGALVLSDNADLEDALVDWATEQGRRFAYFQEVPADHWYVGNAIGASAPA